MKIIGNVDSRNYLAVVSHTEIEKSLDLYYGNLKQEVKVGSEFALGAGYDFRGDIKSACGKMVEAVAAFEAAQKTMMKFAVMVSQLNDGEQS